MKVDELFGVKGQVAIVTGAASGLGLAMTEGMAQNGAAVLMIDIDPKTLEAAAAPLRSAGCTIETAALDVANTAALRSAIDSMAARHGKLDTVFANAGMSSGPGYGLKAGKTAGLLENVSPDTWERVLQVNLTAVLETMRSAVAHMKPRRSGRIVVTASIAGIRAETICGYPYVATKAAVINIVRQAAVELAPHNVLVNAIAPGVFLTNIAGGKLKTDAAVREEFLGLIPMGRIAEANEIQGLALFLASAASSYLTGQVIAIDGGITAA